MIEEDYPRPTTYYLLPTIDYLLPTTIYLLPTTHYLLPSTYYLVPTTYYLLPTTYYRLQRPRLQLVRLLLLPLFLLLRLLACSTPPMSSVYYPNTVILESYQICRILSIARVEYGMCLFYVYTLLYIHDFHYMLHVVSLYVCTLFVVYFHIYKFIFYINIGFHICVLNVERDFTIIDMFTHTPSSTCYEYKSYSYSYYDYYYSYDYNYNVCKQQHKINGKFYKRS